MSSLFIALNNQKKLAFDPYVNGHALSRSEKTLDKLAKRLRVTPLMEFFSTSQDEAREFDVELDDVLEEEWFKADDGLKTVRALMQHLEKNPRTRDAGAIVDELQEWERVLTAAKKHKLKWHLSVDM